MGSLCGESVSGEQQQPAPDRIIVVCRVRPTISRENFGAAAQKCVTIAEDGKTIVLASKPTNRLFTFDYAAGEESTQEEMFEQVGKPITQACLEGYNGTIFCYGQTGSGKTFTTFGPSAAMENALDPQDPRSLSQRGLVPRVLEFLFDSIAAAAAGGRVTYACRCSFYEIFNERVFDLLDSASSASGPNGLNVREDTRKGVYVEGLTEEQVTGADAAGSILFRGYRNRHVGETAMNRESSRSHAVFTLVIEAREEALEEGLTRCRVARFNLVDLAGSERQKSTQTGGDRLKEASSINGSLSTLGQVISALVEKSAGRERHVAYRNSRLTFLLRDSLGGNSKTLLVAAVSPASINFAETLSTLKFAQRAKMIKNMAIKNEDTSGSFEALKAEVASLRQQLALAAAGPQAVRPGRASMTPAEFKAARLSFGSANAAAAAKLLSLDDGVVSLEALTAALRCSAAAEAARDAANARAESLLALVDKAEKAAMQKEMILKFRDSALAAQRKKDSDAERAAMTEEIAFLQKELEAGGDKESQEAARWKLAYKQAEAKLLELTGTTTDGATTTGRPLVWSIEDHTKFTSLLDGQVASLAEEVAHLRAEADAFELRMEEAIEVAARDAEGRAVSRELADKQIVEDALLKKLQESHKAQEEAELSVREAHARLSTAEASRTELLGRVGNLAKHLDDERRRAKAAEAERDAQLAALQAKIEALSAEREAAAALDREGSELSTLRVQLATAVKDNGVLLRRAREAAAEADEMEDDLERAQESVAAGQAALQAEKDRAAAEAAALEAQMKQQEEAYERELEEKLAEKLALDKELDEAQSALQQQGSAHAAALASAAEEQQRLSAALAAAHATAQELESRVSSLQDDCDTLAEQVAFSNGRVEELEGDLHTAQAAAAAAAQRAASLAQELAAAAEAAAQQQGALASALDASQAQVAQAQEALATAAADHAAAAAAAEAAAAAAAAQHAAMLAELESAAAVAAERDAAVTRLSAEAAEAAAQHADTAAALDAAAAALAARESSIVELEAAAARADAERTAVEAARAAAAAAAEERERAIAALEATAARAAEEQTYIVAAISSANASLAERESTIVKLEAAAVAAAARHADAAAAAGTELAAAAAARDGFEAQLAHLREEHRDAAQAHHAAQAALLAQLQSADAAAAAAAHDLQQQLAHERERSQQAGDSAAEAAALAAALQDKIESLESAVEQSWSAANALSCDLATAREESVRAAAAAQAQHAHASAEVAVMRDAVSAAEEQCLELGEQLEVALKQVSEAAAFNAELTALNSELMLQRDSTREEAATSAAAAAEELASAQEQLAHRELQLEQASGALRTSAEDLRVALAERERVERDLQGRLAGVTADLQSAAAQLEAKTAALVALEATLESLKQEKASSTAQAAQALATVGELTVSLARQTAEAETSAAAAAHEAELRREAAARHAAAAAAMDAELQLRTRELQAKSEEVETLQLKLEDRIREGSCLTEALTDLQGQLAQAIEQVGTMREESVALAQESSSAAVEAEEMRFTLEAQISTLQGEISRLREGRLSPGERGALEGRLGAALSRSEALAADVLRLTQAVELEQAARAAAEEAAAEAEQKAAANFNKFEKQREANAQLAGHNNLRQKIQMHEQLKKEIKDLQRVNKELSDEVFRLKKLLHGPASKPPAAAAAAALDEDGLHEANKLKKQYNLRNRIIGADVTNQST